MRNIIGLVAVLGLASGLVGAFMYDQLGSDAGAAPPPPSATQVREQNLDANGFIRVHEQGTSTVTGTVNVGNLPTVQDVNVVSMPSSTPVDRVYTFATDFTGGNFLSQAMDTSGCRKLEVFLNFGQPNIDAYQIIVWESTDAVNKLLLTTKAGFQILDARIASWGSPTIANWVFVEVRNLGAGVLNEGVLHCVSE